MRSKRPLTLIEILLAMTLFSLVVGTLFHFLKTEARLSKQLEIAKTRIIEHSELYAYLLKIFTKIQGKPLIKDNTLEFVFDHGLDQEEAFSGQVHALLFVKKGHLILTLSSLDKKHERTETLKTAVTKFVIEEPINNAITLTINEKTYPFFYTAKL